ncbi:hypothetical protein D3C71_1942390 [compost metagenome]
MEIFIHDRPGAVYISYYRLPLGRMVYRNDPAKGGEDVIDFEPLAEHVGSDVVLYRNGSLEGTVKLAQIKEIDGVPALVFEPELALEAEE